jgi:hypothetical protein
MLNFENFLAVTIFKNGCHNTAQIQHCSISTTFHMWVDYDVPNLFPTLKNFYRSPCSKWPPLYRKNSALSVLWQPFLKMVTARKFSMSGINAGHHNLPIYEMSLESDNVEFVRYCGVHFENGDR